MKTDAMNKAARKCNLSVEEASEIITHHHSMLYLEPKRSMVTIQVNMGKTLQRKINKIAATLHVSVDAIIAHILCRAVEQEGKHKPLKLPKDRSVRIARALNSPDIGEFASAHATSLGRR